jgi:2-C-methyl-D-erythritol 2,4-cyclodiphosphate synthase
VAAHAAVDALLGAAGLGDIGAVFGTDDPRWAGAPGVAFLRETARRVRAAGYAITHVSIEVIGPRPKLSPRRADAEKTLSEAIGAPVSVAATTTDGLGVTGAGDGIAAFAVATLAYVTDSDAAS